MTAEFGGVVWDAVMASVWAARDYYDEHPMRDFDVWLAKWPKSKRDAILHSIMSEDPLCPGRLQADVKRECLSNLPTKARLIQYYFNMRTQAEYGPQFYAMQKAFGDVFVSRPLGPYADLTFASGMNSTAISEWARACVARGARCYYERDGKCWDATMNLRHAAARIAAYSILDPALAEFARQCVTARGVIRGADDCIKYEIEGTVKSGHNDTTSGNSFINGVIASHVFHAMCVRCSILVAGDDLLVACYDDFDINDAMSREAAFGIKPEARKFTSLFDTSFISGIFAYAGERIFFIPRPGKLLAKLFWTVNPPSVRNSRAYQRGVARGLLPSCGSIPIVRSFLRAFDDGGAGAIYNPRGYVFHGQDVDVGEQFMVWFCQRYGVSEAEVRACEARLSLLPSEPIAIIDPMLELLANRDLCDLVDRDHLEPAYDMTA